MMLFILHKHIVSQLCILTAVTAGSTVWSAVGLVRHIEHLAVGAAGSVLQSPPVIFCGQIINILFLKT